MQSNSICFDSAVLFAFSCSLKVGSRVHFCLCHAFIYKPTQHYFDLERKPSPIALIHWMPLIWEVKRFFCWSVDFWPSGYTMLLLLFTNSERKHEKILVTFCRKWWYLFSLFGPSLKYTVYTVNIFNLWSKAADTVVNFLPWSVFSFIMMTSLNMTADFYSIMSSHTVTCCAEQGLCPVALLRDVY